jgi:CARDB/Dockerin type I domain
MFRRKPSAISVVAPVLLISLLAPMFISTSVKAMTSTVSVVPSSLTVPIEQNFSVDIAISEVMNLYGWEFTLTWNPDLLAVANVIEGSFLKGDGRPTFFTYNISTYDGKIVVDCTLLGWIPGASGTGILSTLTFNSKSYGECSLDLYNVSLVDSFEQPIPYQTSNGYVRVISPHDVAVSYVEVSPLLAPIGDPVNVNMSIQNEGNYDEVFEVSAYANSTIIWTQQISLSSGSSTNVFFTWNTTTCLKGDYVILAAVGSVPGEVDLVDNTKTAENLVTLLTVGHDVSVIAIKPAKTAIGQGFDLIVTVKTSNYGIFGETFNVTVYLNTSVLGSQAVSLSSGTKTDLIFVKSSSSFSKGIYTLSASASPVLGETEIGDNTLFEGLIVITIPGDIQGDFVVDIFDAINLANAFNSVPSSPGWDPNADINCDTSIDIYDAIILANHFGQRYP